MNIRQEGQELLKVHSYLREQLIKIPEKRDMEYNEEVENGKRLGKPRFRQPLYDWSEELLTNLRNHLQNIWNFFDQQSYWLDSTIMPLIAYVDRRVSKKSIIFLLENDVWSTDEVYGKYLIEKSRDETIISYFRREQKIRQFKLPILSDSEIKSWICIDAVNQIKGQFDFLWSKLETEISACIDEIFHRKPKLTITSDYLELQLQKTKNISEEWPEAALLSLGRILELWLLISLGRKKKGYSPFADFIRDAELVGLIEKPERKLLSKIWRAYNNLKHKTYFKVEKKFVISLIEEFSNLLIN